MAYFQANNYVVENAADVITFKGAVQRSVSQACFLVFCTFIGLGSLALVLQISFPVIGQYWSVRTSPRIRVTCASRTRRRPRCALARRTPIYTDGRRR